MFSRLAAASLFFFFSASQAQMPKSTNLDFRAAPTADAVVRQSPAPGRALDAARRPVALEVVSSGPEGLVLEFSCDSFALESDRLGSIVTFDGAERGAPGEPDLPHLSVLVGLPQSGTVRASASVSGTQVRGGVRPRPVPSFSSVEPATLDGGLWPAQAVEVGPVEQMRDVRVARVVVNPVQYDARTGELRLHSRLRVNVSFSARPVESRRPDPLDSVIAATLANGREAVNWRLDRLPDDTLNFFARSADWCRIRLDTTGLYRVEPADLKAAGYSPDAIDPATLKLYSIGPYTIGANYPDTMVEVATHLVDNGDGKFSGDDALVFFAEAPSRREAGDTAWRYSPYARYSALWLTWGGAAGRRMAEVSGASTASPPARGAARERIERDLLCPARSGLLWLWTNVFKPAGTLSLAETIALPVPGRDTIYELAGRCLGRSGDNQLATYRAKIYLNGAYLDTIRIPAASNSPPQTLFRLRVPAEAGARSGADTLVFELYGDPEADVFLDWFEVHYAQKLALDRNRPYLEFWSYDSAAGVDFALEGGASALVLDVADPWSPKRITGGRVEGERLVVSYRPGRLARIACGLSDRARTPAAIEKRAPGNLRNPAEDADYYIITPDEFAPAAELLARYRTNNIAGMVTASVRVARLSQVYDDYGFGMEEPGAIRRFLQAKRPAYVLLAGDGNYDYKDILGLGKGAGVPPCELGYDIDPEVYGNIARALDAWYADLDGGNVPDLVLGRITCRNAVELRSYIDKVRNYEAQPTGFWAKRFLLVADDEWLGQVDPRYIDPIGYRHIASCELMNTISPDRLDPVKIYLTEYPLTTTNLKAGAQADLLKRLDDGALLWSFFGHGAGFQLCHEQILHITNTVPQVKTGLRQSVAFFGSCGVGRFDDTRYEAVAEELVRREEGCIATVAATKATDPGGNEALARGMFTFLVQRPDLPVGAAFYSAYSRTNTLYHLFGDPGLKLRLPALGIAPVATPDTFWPGGRVAIADSVPVPAGHFELAAYEEQWYRRYSSDAGPTQYRLNGYNLSRAGGRFDSSSIAADFMVPRVEYPDTTIVPNGSYVREPGTCRVSVLAWAGDSAWSSSNSGLWLGDSIVEPDDNAPPDIELWADGIRLAPGDTTDVPKNFTLTGVITDPSGVLLVPSVDAGLSLQIGTAPRVELAGYFRYDNNSSTKGRFEYPIRLEQKKDAITVIATDNVVSPLNNHRRLVQVALSTRLDEALQLTDVLVWPNPATGPARFTFNLSRPAYVTVKVFTLAGRLIRVLPARLRGLGYGEVEWDGLDAQGRLPGNGVYLYKLDARASESSTGAGQSAATHRDRFIIHR
ncbi:MAG: C25 family cysteine peptidase [bacterium]